MKQDLRSIQDSIVAKQFDAALTELDRMLMSDPDNDEALYMSAVCRRYTRDFEGALRDLDRLKSLTPEHGRAHQEEGHTLRDMGRKQEAADAYARACRYNPALVSSWENQLLILDAAGNAQAAAQARAQLNHLKSMARPLVAVMDLLSQGRLLKAEDVCRQYLQKVPQDTDGMRLLAQIGMKFGALEDAEFLLSSARKLAPEDAQVAIDYIQVLRKRQKFEAALDEAKALLDTNPENPQFLSIYAIECMQVGDYDSALASFDKVLEKVPSDPATLTSRGHAYKTLGHYEPAVGAYHDAIASQPAHGEAYYSLANLKVYAFEDDELQRMQAQEQNPNLSHMDRVYLCFALGKAFEDREDFSQSFDYFKRGNQLKKVQSKYSAERMTEDLAAQKTVCTSALFEQYAGSGCDAPDPIFIVGLPRAGSTLLEQILSSHSQVDGTLELPNVLSLTQQLRRLDKACSYPDILARLTGDDFRRYGEAFIEDTRIHRAGAPFFIDKMPNNFRHIGLIRLMLPNAKIIDARRNPMACCFSGYQQLFAEGQEFSYDLADVGQYYRDYVDLMAHWDEVLPGFVLRVQHEDVVDDLETEVRRMLDFCGLPFEEACLEFHRTQRNIKTPSSEQVRQPIYRSGLDRWRNYEPWLESLKAAVGKDLLDRYGINWEV